MIAARSARQTGILCAATLAALLLAIVPVFAACTSPAGNAGDVFYSAPSTIMVYCNGTNWIGMGINSAVSFGTLTTNDFCTATSGTAIACTTGSTGTGSVVLSASPTLTGTVTATTFSGSGASLTNIGTSNMTSVTGTPNSTTYLRGDNTWATTASGGGSGTVTSSSAGDVAYYQSTGTTVIGTSTLTITNGEVGINTATPTTNLSVYNGNQSATLTNFTHALTNAGIDIMSGYTAGDYTPGIFWSTANNNATLPKAGIWTETSSSGSYLNFGTSNSYSTGITNQAMMIDYSGQVGIGMTPGMALDVNGNIRTNNILYIGAGGANIYDDTGTNGDITLIPNGSGVIDTSWGSTIEVLNNSGNIGINLAGTGVSYFNVGNVGIGTATPLSLVEAYGGPLEDMQLSIGTTSTDGIMLYNTKAATVSLNQYSPRIHFEGQGWKTNTTAASQAIDMIEELRPQTGAANPSGNLVWSSSANGGAYSALMTLTSGGSVGIGSSAPAAVLDLSLNTGAVAMPVGTTTQRPSTLINGMQRYNSTTATMEAYVGGNWIPLQSIQSPVTNVVTSGASCSNVGQLATDSSSNLLVCVSTVIAGQSCSAEGVGALTFDTTGALYVCLQ